MGTSDEDHKDPNIRARMAECAMPELPEVETTRRGIAPYLIGRRVTGVILRRPDLRWPIPREVSELLPGQRIDAVERRAKYLLLHTEAGSALLHLGMSGVLRVLPPDAPVGRHDTDSDGTISLQEFQTAHERIFKAMDTNKDGKLTLEEMQAFMHGTR